MKRISDFFKEKQTEKEVVRAKTVSADPFGRVICESSNGTFRAVGVIKKGDLAKEVIVGNLYQREAEFYVLQNWERNKI